jgi:hypothetical protein
MSLVAANCALHGQLFVWLKAMGRMAVTLPHMFRERRRIQRQRKVSVADVDGILYEFIPPIHKRFGKNSPPPTLRKLRT